MAQMAETLPTAFREILQINSPSVVMQEIGYHAGEGFANGFSQAQSMITTAVNAAGQSIISQSDLTVSGFLSNLQTLFAGSKAIGMAIAAVNIGRGLSEALALPFPASLAAFAKVAAMGAQALATIKGASPGRGSIAGGRGGGGGGGGRSGRGGAASAGGGTSLNLQLLGSNFSEASVRGLISQINKAIENGAVLKSVRVV
jgi:hypothetical protein